MNKNKDCPSGKELNPKTGRCINKCKEGEVRNLDTGRCIKIKLKLKSKDCPSGKELNPKTGRCVNKCKEGEVRDKITGKCLKIKPKLKSKDCPSGKELNPKTGRCINKCKEGEVRNTKTGKCIKIKIKKDSDKMIDKMISDLELPPKSEKSSLSIYIDSPILTNQYTLYNRIKLYKKAKYYLNQISNNECLKNIKINGEKLMTLSNKLFLDKRIGSKSVYGAIYLSSIHNIPDLLLVSKVNSRNKSNLKEVTIMNDLTDNLLLTYKSKHFPLIYSSHICNEKAQVNPASLVSVNELCNGDLKMLLEDKSNYPFSEKTLYNMLFQIFISIATYQEYSKNIHNDCHYGNILYQTNTEKGYYKYTYKTYRFYLESCPYNMMLYDFGLVNKPYWFDYSAFFKDFYRIIHAFIPEKYGGWNLYLQKSEFVDNMIIIKNNIRKMIEEKKVYSFDIILNELWPYMKDISKGKKDSNDVILNTKSFIIG
jgi:hypothetical protein